MANAEQNLSTIDFGVVATFQQKCHSCSNHQNLVLASLEYVGWIEEILEHDYGKLQNIVFSTTMWWQITPNL
jgi:hypothetical protein